MESFHVVTRSKSKAEGSQLPKVHGVDKAVSPSLKPQTQVNREGIPKPTLMIPESVSQSQRIIPPSIPKKDKEGQMLEGN